MSDNIQTPEVSADETVVNSTNVDSEPGLIAYMFTNHKEQVQMLQSYLDMFYRGAYANTIGLQSAYNTETGLEEVLIVGVQHDGAITKTYPLARILANGEEAKYVAPDGKGGWLDGNDDEEPEEGIALSPEAFDDLVSRLS